MQKMHLQKAGFDVQFDGAHFNEIVVKCQRICQRSERTTYSQKDIIGGYDLGLKFARYTNHALIAVTELRTKEEIDALVEEIAAFVQETEAFHA